jgi:hypothetical protein
MPAENPFVVISGCSGGGKSTLLNELARRGHATVAEPGRRIVEEELSGDGSALPWVDAAAFARRAMALAVADHSAASRSRGWVFFDRGLIDAAAALQHLTGEPVLAAIGQSHRYYHRMLWRRLGPKSTRPTGSGVMASMSPSPNIAVSRRLSVTRLRGDDPSQDRRRRSVPTSSCRPCSATI